MQRLTAAFLVASLVGIGAGSSVTAQSPTPETATHAGPVVLGGRIEVPSAGFAVTVPEGWYAFDISDPGFVAAMESFDELTAMLAPTMASFSLESMEPDLAAAFPLADLPLVAFAPFDGPTAGENCILVVEPMATASLDFMVAAELLTMRAMVDTTADLVPVFVDLPTGRAGMVEYSTPYAGSGELARTVYMLLHDHRGYTLTCTDATSHGDRWLSLAESIEFLPDANAPTAAGSQGPTLSTPEGAVREYLAGVADADVERILGATAVDEVSEGFRFDLFTDRIYAFTPRAPYAPSEYPFFAEGNRAMKTSQILSQVRMLAYSLLSETPIGSETIRGTDLDPDPLRWGQEFVRQVDPSRLAGITLIDIIHSDPERAEDEIWQSIQARTRATLGADDTTERLAIISFEGETYAVGFTLLRYGDEWFVDNQSSPVGDTDPIGIAMPYTVEE